MQLALYFNQSRCTGCYTCVMKNSGHRLSLSRSSKRKPLISCDIIQDEKSNLGVMLKER